jgi:hypothetical protein
MTKRRRTVEKPAGRGKLVLANKALIRVQYSLVVIERLDDEAETGQLAGQREIRGAIGVDTGQGMVELAGQTFTLRLNDGRCLEAEVKKGDPITGQWEIAGAGAKGLEPC